MSLADLIREVVSDNTVSERECPTPLDLAFDLQKPLIEATDETLIAVLPRQAGKTTAAVLKAIHVAEKPTSRLVTYVTKTRRNAKRLFWRPLLEWAAKCGHDVTNNVNLSDLTLRIDHDDGSYCLIELMGADDIVAIEDLRGTQYDLVIVDESQRIRTSVLQMLLTEVIFPGCRVRNGIVLMIGTPGPLKAGPFYEAYESGTWRRFRWTAYDNPATPPGSIEKEVEKAGLTITDPRYIREYLAQWCDGRDDLMVWQYEPGRDDIDVTLPQGFGQKGFETWRFSWGLDIASSHDNDALVVLGWDTRDGLRRLYEVDSWEGPGTELIDELERVLREKREIWKPATLVGDIGGHGAKKIVNTIAAKLKLNLQAKPTDVEGTVRLINTDFRTGRLKIQRGGKLAQDMRQEYWRIVTRPNGDIRREIDGETHSDLTAACRYAYMASRADASRADPKPPVDPDQAREQQILKYLKQQSDRRARGRWGVKHS